MKTRTLPKNISAHPDGWLVRVVRNGIRLQGFFPKKDKRGLEKAIALRDKFIAELGTEIIRPNGYVHRRAKSNTGITGISETIHWAHSRPHPCFSVSWSNGGKQRMKRIHYQGVSDREAALQRAIQLREEKTGCPAVVPGQEAYAS